MNFTDKSPVVQSWVRLINNGTYTREEIPNIGNLQEIVCGILDK
jgi:hypothetical protein